MVGLDSLKLLTLCTGLNAVLSWRPPGGYLQNKFPRGTRLSIWMLICCFF